jgi:hypothetical protein
MPSPLAAFERVSVDYAIAGGARVSWDLARHFVDPSPATWVYTLQASIHGLLPSVASDNVTVRTDDWVNVASGTNVASLIDPTKRAFGKTLLVAYRVQVVTPVATYISPPGSTLGHLPKQDWLIAQEITRKEILLHKKRTSVSGFLLRRKRNGTPCPKCLDPGTGEVTLSRCDICKGSRFTSGYWAAVPTTFCRLEPREGREHRNIEGPGPEKKDVTTGRMIFQPGMVSGDVWVDGQSDLRYHAHLIKVISQVRHVPLIYQVELRQAAFDDVIYTISLSGG